MPSYKELYEPVAKQMAEKYNLDVEIFLALINQESRWDPNAQNTQSGTGINASVGIAQIIPRWHPNCPNPWDPTVALECAAIILRHNLNTFNGQYDWALAAYHQGINAAIGFGKSIPPGEMNSYVKPILNNANELRQIQKKVETPALLETATATATPSSPLMLPSPTPTPLVVDMLLFVLPLVWASIAR